MVDDSTQTTAPSGNATSEHAAAAAPAGTTADRTRGHSPARDAREQQPTPQERMIRVGESDFSEKQITDSLAFRAEQDVRERSLPPSADKYEIKLPADFKAPEGFKFEFDMNDPLLKSAREAAFTGKLGQENFSKFLGLYAANKIAEQQRLAPAREAELSKLGTAATQRIDALETWLKARVGDKSKLLVAQMRNYPVAAMVETFEGLMKQFSDQNGAQFDQRGRSEQEQPTGKIAGYDNMSFTQKRVAQMGQQFGAKRGQGGTER
jgi:hypothetical protein